MKKVWKVWILILLMAALTLSLFSCRTGAVWQRQATDTQDIETDVAEVNGSEKYIVFAALSSSGELIAATDDSTVAAAYAVVGYTGLVAELVIPARYTDTTIYTAASGTNHSLPVTKVLVLSSYSSYKCSMDGAAYSGNDARLANNTVVKSIVFGSNVASVGAGVCQTMINVESVTFKKANVGLGGYAFAYCTRLATVTGTYTDANSTAFVGCAYTPA